MTSRTESNNVPLKGNVDLMTQQTQPFDESAFEQLIKKKLEEYFHIGFRTTREAVVHRRQHLFEYPSKLKIDWSGIG